MSTRTLNEDDPPFVWRLGRHSEHLTLEAQPRHIRARAFSDPIESDQKRL